jgi:hypothetical protein
MTEVGTIVETETAKIPTRNGSGFEYKYADLSKVLKVVNPALADNGLFVSNSTKVVDGQNILVVSIFHISGETLPPSEILIPKGSQSNDLYNIGGAITYLRRYLLLAKLNLNAGIKDDDGAVYNKKDNVTPINKNKAVGMPTILDDETKQYYLQIVGSLLVKDKKLYNILADALYIEFDFDRNKKLSENIKLPKHVIFIEEWLAANQ